MANPLYLDADPYGILATHPPRETLPVLAAPIPDEQKTTNFNTFRPQLIAIGCMRLPNTGFAFDSSVISPDAERAFTRFAKLMQALRDQDDANPKRFPPCSVFGHADPIGKDDYNKTLSGRRALAVYAVLVRNIDIWEELFQNSFGGDAWGIQSIQTMLTVSLSKTPDGEAEKPYYSGPIDGAKTKQTKQDTDDAVAAYRMARGLNNINDVRKTLFKEYMDAICHDPSGQPFVLDPKKDFLAKGKGGKGLKGDVQGCSEFNPIFLLAKKTEEDLSSHPDMIESRNDIYRVDRRVLVFMFKHGTEIDQTLWPCPAARDDATGCRLRFWSDGDQRRAESDYDRTFGEKMSLLTLDESNNVTMTPVQQTGNTMACRFYHAFAHNSPCEAKVKEWVIRFMVDSFKGQRPLRYRRFVFTAGETESAAVIRGFTDENGVLRIPVFDDKAKMTLSLDAARVTGPDVKPPDDTSTSTGQAAPDESKYAHLVFDGGALHPRDITDNLAVRQRLYNMGFGDGDPTGWTDDQYAIALRHFRIKTLVKPDNRSDDDVLNDVMKEHDIYYVVNPPADDGADSSSAPGSSAAPGSTSGGDGSAADNSAPATDDASTADNPTADQTPADAVPATDASAG